VPSAGGQTKFPRRLTSRPPKTPPTGKLAIAGLQGLGLGGLRDGYLYVPESHTADHPLPLLVLLHGATGSATNFFGTYGKRAEDAKFIVLAPDSRASTWDIAVGGYFDVAFIDRALAMVFEKCAIHPQKIAIAGHSDGASYALTLGLTNGDLFDHVVAYSPGFLAGVEQHGTPKIFIAHGTEDTILPIDNASRRIVPQLRRAGYDVDYREFRGGHRTPPEIADAGMRWLKDAYG
jgi:phospholipase/carboxylesterase